MVFKFILKSFLMSSFQWVKYKESNQEALDFLDYVCHSIHNMILSLDSLWCFLVNPFRIHFRTNIRVILILDSNMNSIKDKIKY